MNIGIIGAGNISSTHARAAEAVPGTCVVAVCGDNLDKVRLLAERHRAAAYDSLDQFLAHRGMDAVFIGSPSGLHAQQAIAAVRHGLHVLVEKPIDITTSRVDRLLDEVSQSGVTLGVFFQDRLKPDVVAMKRHVEDEAIGTPVLATGEVKWYRPPEHYSSSRWRGTFALDGGGALMNQGIHTVDLLLYLLGKVTRVSGVTATRFHTIEAEDSAVATLHFESGALATIEATTAAYPGFPRRLEILGSEGSLLLEGDRLVRASVVRSASAGLKPTPSGDSAAPIRVAEGAGFSPAEPPSRVVEGARFSRAEPPSPTASVSASSPVVSDISAHQRIIEDFFDAIRSRRPPICDGAEGRRSVAIVEAIYRSARDGVVITL